MSSNRIQSQQQSNHFGSQADVIGSFGPWAQTQMASQRSSASNGYLSQTPTIFDHLFSSQNSFASTILPTQVTQESNEPNLSQFDALLAAKIKSITKEPAESDQKEMTLNQQQGTNQQSPVYLEDMSLNFGITPTQPVPIQIADRRKAPRINTSAKEEMDKSSSSESNVTNSDQKDIDRGSECKSDSMTDTGNEKLFYFPRHWTKSKVSLNKSKIPSGTKESIETYGSAPPPSDNQENADIESTAHQIRDSQSQYLFPRRGVLSFASSNTIEDSIETFGSAPPPPTALLGVETYGSQMGAVAYSDDISSFGSAIYKHFQPTPQSPKSKETVATLIQDHMPSIDTQYMPSIAFKSFDEIILFPGIDADILQIAVRVVSKNKSFNEYKKGRIKLELSFQEHRALPKSSPVLFTSAGKFDRYAPKINGASLPYDLNICAIYQKTHPLKLTSQRQLMQLRPWHKIRTKNDLSKFMKQRSPKRVHGIIYDKFAKTNNFKNVYLSTSSGVFGWAYWKTRSGNFLDPTAGDKERLLWNALAKRNTKMKGEKQGGYVRIHMNGKNIMYFVALAKPKHLQFVSPNKNQAFVV